MNSHYIHIPETALVVRSSGEYGRNQELIWTITINSGDVVVLRRQYSPDGSPFEHAYTEEDAKDKALTEFGERLLKLIDPKED